MTALELSSITKRFAGRSILRDISLRATTGDVVGILGENGSGKSTLMRIIAGVLRPDSGSVTLSIDGIGVPDDDRPQACGFVAPYLELYDEFTPRELLRLDAHLHGRHITDADIDRNLHDVGLQVRGNDAVSTFSSGLRQRTALAVAISGAPALLLLDEPSTTLDAEGRAVLARIVRSHAERGGLVIIATNDEREHDLCTSFLTVPSSPAPSSSR